MINNDLSFKGRQQVIRDAKWVAKTAHNTFPHISSTMSHFRIMECRKYCDDYCGKFDISECLREVPSSYCPLDRLFCKIGELAYKARHKRFSSNKGMSSFMYSYNTVERMRSARFGNCHEDAVLAEIVARMNGAKNVQTASLRFGSEGLDHEVMVLSNKLKKEGAEEVLKAKEAIVVDSWLGIADYAGNFIDIIKHNYNRIFEMTNAGKPNEKVVFAMKTPIKLNNADIDALKGLYPGLIFHGNNGRKLFENV